MTRRQLVEKERTVKSANMEPRALVMNPTDTVATLLDPARRGDRVTLLDPALRTIDTVCVREAIEPFHKLAIREVAKGDPVRKLGEVIGTASAPIAQGEQVHVHNLVSARLGGRMS